MKKNLLLAAAAFLVAVSISLPARADGYSYLTLCYGDVEQSIALTDLKKITFTGGKLTAFTTDGSQEFTLSQMKKLFFSATATDVESAVVDETSLSYDPASQTLNVGAQAAGGRLTVLFTNGRTALAQRVDGAGARVSFSSLPKGLYIVHLNGETLKIMR